MTDLFVGGIVLAAGASRRMGSPKAFLRIRGKTFLEYALGLLEAAPCARIVVVCPPGRKNAFDQPAPSVAEVVENPLPERGMLSSLSIGFDAMPESVTHVLVTLVDTPLIRHETITHLLAECRLRADRVIVPTHDGEPGHPILIPRAIWAPMAAWQGPMGAQGFLRANPHLVSERAVPDPGILRDIDTPEELTSLLAGPETPPP